MTEHDVENLRREVETFDDGHQSVCCYDVADRLVRIETRNADNVLKIAIYYHYDEAGNNVLRNLRYTRPCVKSRGWPYVLHSLYCSAAQVKIR
jgi:hypothetical protein